MVGGHHRPPISSGIRVPFIVVSLWHANSHRRSRPNCHSEGASRPPGASPRSKSRHPRAEWAHRDRARRDPDEVGASTGRPGCRAHREDSTFNRRDGARYFGANAKVIAVDTSVVVAAFASWHEGHSTAAAALARKPRIPAHVLVETYSVLTRLPPPHRAQADLVVTFLRERFQGTPLALPPRAHLRLIEQAAASGITGGSIHDALVAATALHSKARLLTRDRRAAPTYERFKVDFDFLG